LNAARRLGALVLVVAFAACTDDDASAPAAPDTASRPPASLSPPTTGEAPPTSATGDLDTALSRFAAAYAPLPGIEPAAVTPVDGGPVLRAVLAATDELDEAQRDIVGRVVAPAGEPLDEILSDGQAPAQLQSAARVVRAALEAFGGARGRPFSNDVATTLVLLPYANRDGTHNFSSPRSIATAVPVGDGARPYAECRIRINDSRPLTRPDAVFVSSVAHEAFHCLQYEVLPFAQGAPSWIVEGAAAYAGEDFAGGSPASRAWWRRWVRQPQHALGRRSHDAIGFFSLLPGTTNPYAFADALLTDPSVDSVRRRLEASDVFDRWGLAYATRPRWGRRYAITGPGAPAALTAPWRSVTLRVDQPATVAGKSAVTGLAASPVRVRVPGDVLVVTADPGDRGGLRFGDGQEAALAEATQAYCVRPGGCPCPGVPRDAIPATPVESNELFVGVGPSSGGGPALAARSLGQWCQELLVPAPPAGSVDQCLARAWTSQAYVAPGVSGAEQTVTGGAGVEVEFRPDRTVTVDMDSSSPAVIGLTGPDGATVTTTVEYTGLGTGTWSAAGGVVNVAGVDPSSFVVRVRIESSKHGVLADRELRATDVRLSGFAGLLGTGRYECTAVSLTITHVVPGVGGEAGFEFTPSS
jgi:hypothetical protein